MANAREHMGSSDSMLLNHIIVSQRKDCRLVNNSSLEDVIQGATWTKITQDDKAQVGHSETGKVG